MKTKIFTFLLLTLPFLISSQTLTIAEGATVTIGAGAAMTTGTIANNGDATSLIIKSSAANATGSLIFESGTPLATVERYVDEQAWHQVSSPTGDVQASVFLSGQDAVWLTELQPDQIWRYITDVTETINQGQGYSYWIGETPARASNTVSFTGNLTAGDVTFPVNPGVDNYTLIGNPYTATINFASVPSTGGNPNIEKSIWVWDNTLNSGDYLYATFLASPPEDETLTPPYIAVGQAFMMKTIDGGSPGNPGNVTFKTDYLIHEPGATFYKHSKEKSDATMYVTLNVSQDNLTDVATVWFGENGSTGFENGYDVSKLLHSTSAPRVYLVEDETKYTRNYLKPLEEDSDQIVKLSYIVGITGEQQISVDLSKLPATDVMLEDLLSGQMINLNKHAIYTFNGNTDDNPDRFRLHFKYSPTGIEDPGNAEDKSVNIYSYNDAVYINNTSTGMYDRASVAIYDMYGREIYFNKTQLNNLTRIPVSVRNAYLVVKVATGEKVYTEKVFVQ